MPLFSLDEERQGYRNPSPNHEINIYSAYSYMLGICASAQTDAYIKLYDHHGKHPRIVSITYPGDANSLDMYNSIYGHGAVIENP